MKAKKVRIMETVLRDGHQSILATRMRTSQMLPVLEKLDAEVMKHWNVGAAQHLTAAFVSWTKIHGNVFAR